MPHYYCIRCGEEFTSVEVDEVLCPKCRRLSGAKVSSGIPLSKPPELSSLQIITHMEGSGTLVMEEQRPSAPLKEYRPEDLTPWEEGQVIAGLYKVKGSAIGGMGVVYFVDHLKWRIPLAVKTPLPEIVADEISMKRFIREAEVWIDLGLHPHIVTCFYVRQIGGLPRIFMEYVDGGSLKDWIRDGRVKGWKDILDLAIQFCRGMEYAHRKGVIHRDIKPANCLMTRDGTLKITDFGLVKAIGIREIGDAVSVIGQRLAVEGGSLTIGGGIVGTPEYMAPEQFEGAKELGREADIYSFGVMLFEMVCGRRPFILPDSVHPYARGILYKEKHMNEIPPEPISLRQDCPKRLNDLILKCLTKDPERRREHYPSFEAICEELEDLYEEIVKEPYPGEMIEEIELRADSLNNRGVSYLDLNREEEAVRCWEEALRIDPAHLESNLNLTYYKWVTNGIGVEEVCRRLDMLINWYERDANFWFYKFLIELEITGAVGFHERPIESITKALLCGSKEELVTHAAQLLKEEIRKWSHPGAGGVYETSKVIFERLVRQKMQSLIEVKEIKGATSVLPTDIEGKFLVSDSEGFVKVWNYMSCDYEKQWRVSTKPIRFLSANQGFILADCDDEVVLLDMENDKDGIKMEHPASERFIHLCNDGKCALSVEVKTELIGHDFGVSEVAVSQTVRLWNIPECKLVASVEIGGNDRVLACSPDGQHFIVFDSLNRVFLRNIHSTEKLPLEFSYPISYFTFVTSDVISGCSYFPPYFYLIWWEIKDKSIERRVQTLVEPGSPLHVSSSYDLGIKQVLGYYRAGNYLLAVTTQSTIQIWDTAKGFLLCSYFNSLIDERTPRGMYPYSISSFAIDKHKNLWIVYVQEDKHIIAKFSRPNVFSYILAPPQKYESAYKAQREFQEVVARAKKLLTEQHHKEAYHTLREFASRYPSQARSIEFLDLLHRCGQKGQRKTLKDYYLRQQVHAHQDRVSALHFGPNGLFCSGSWDRTVKVWSINVDGTNYRLDLIKTLIGHVSGINVVLFSYDGRYIASGSADTTIRLWNVETGECLSVFSGHSQGISCIAFSPNLRLLASGSWEGTLKVWDIVTGQCIATLERVHGMKVSTVKFINDDTLFSSDALRITWNIKTGQYEIYRGSPTLEDYNQRVNVCGKELILPHKMEVTSFALSPDMRFLVTGSEDQTICLFELDWDYDFPEPADWDEGARPYLEIFLTLHTPYGPDGLSRVGAPQWTEEDFQQLLKELSIRGYGWLRPEGVRHELEKMARERGWKGG